MPTVMGLDTAPTTEVATRYANGLAEFGPPLGSCADVARLPVEKVRIRAAVLACLAHSTEPYRSAWAAAYLRLADFQPGIGPNPIPAEEMAARGLGDALGRARTEREHYRLDLKGVGL